MEGDDEWEDHLIVSYTPPQGCEHTLRTEQLDRIVQHTKLEMVQVLDKGPDCLKSVQAGQTAIESWLPEKTSAAIKNLTSRPVNHHHKYWNFCSRSVRSSGMLTAVGSHVFHQDDRGEWSMFAEPGDKGYTGDIRFVLQWKQFDFVFISSDQGAVYQDGKFVKRLAHKYAGNSSFGVQATAKYVYFCDSYKFMWRVDENLLYESPSINALKDPNQHKMVNFSVDARDRIFLLSNHFISVIDTQDYSNQVMVPHSGEKSVSSGAIRHLPFNKVISVFEKDSGNQAILYNMKLEALDTLELSEHEGSVNKIRFAGIQKDIVFVLVNPDRRLLCLAVFRNKVYYVATADTDEDIYTFACLGNSVFLTGGFKKLFCTRLVVG